MAPRHPEYRALKAELALLRARLEESTVTISDGPLLANGDPKEILGRLMEERGPLYSEIADYRFHTDRQSARDLARTILKRLRADRVVA